MVTGRSVRPDMTSSAIPSPITASSLATFWPRSVGHETAAGRLAPVAERGSRRLVPDPNRPGVPVASRAGHRPGAGRPPRRRPGGTRPRPGRPSGTARRPRRGRRTRAGTARVVQAGCSLGPPHVDFLRTARCRTGSPRRRGPLHPASPPLISSGISVTRARSCLATRTLTSDGPPVPDQLAFGNPLIGASPASLKH